MHPLRVHFLQNSFLLAYFNFHSGSTPTFLYLSGILPIVKASPLLVASLIVTKPKGRPQVRIMHDRGRNIAQCQSEGQVLKGEGAGARRFDELFGSWLCIRVNLVAFAPDRKSEGRLKVAA